MVNAYAEQATGFGVHCDLKRRLLVSPIVETLRIIIKILFRLTPHG